MKIIKVNLGKRSYDIVIGNNLLSKAGGFIKNLDVGKDAYIITDPLIKNKYGKLLADSLKQQGFKFRFKTIPASEKSKSLNNACAVINDLADYGNKRQVFIIAFGGGVVGDLSGFAASIYKRGVPYIQIPTTLLAQVDSGIGGKTAVDLENGKNLVGSFYQPKLVLSDLSLLNSLDLKQMRSGIAEVIKYGVIKDDSLFKYLEQEHQNILNKKNAALEFIVHRSSLIKAGIVSQDETEKKNIRQILNFGHTIGHAIETAGNYTKYNHGQAISLGMLVSADISQRLNLTDSQTVKRIEDIIKTFGLPSRIKGISFTSIIKAHYRDKKFTGPKNKFVLIEKIGKTRLTQDIPLKIIKAMLKKRYT